MADNVTEKEPILVLAFSKYIAAHHASYLKGKIELSVETHELGAIVHAKIGKRQYRVIYDEKGNRISSVLVRSPVVYESSLKGEKDGVECVFVADKTCTPHRLRKLDPEGKRKYVGVPIYGNWAKETHIAMLKAYMAHLGYLVVLENKIVTTTAPVVVDESEVK